MNKYSILFLLFLFNLIISASDFKQVFKNLTPDQMPLQFAGNQGVISMGFGYSYTMFKRNRTTDLMYGYIPENISGTDLHIFTLKNTIKHDFCKLRDTIIIVATFNLNTICTISHNTHLMWPDHYPDGYYFTNAFHLQPSIGLEIKMHQDNHTNISKLSFYSELGILDQHTYHYIKTGRVSLLNSINLSLGCIYSFKNNATEIGGKDH